MKYCIKKYPMGSFKRQRTPGKFIERYLYENLVVLAKSIVKDMTFMGICSSSTLEVGTGKSVLMTQIGEVWSEIMYDLHKIELPYSTHNIVWKPKDLIERAFKVPKYSFILIDEWEDAHYWSELGMTLRQFFRKCRQLNLFIMIIIPNFFQMNLSYAVSRSVFFIDVRFEDNFERGHYSFYSFPNKRKLYIEGKRTHNYNAAREDFTGEFGDGYGVPKAEYLKAKREDIEKYEKEEPIKLTAMDLKIDLCKTLWKSGIFKRKDLANAYKVSDRTITRWIKEDFVLENAVLNPRSGLLDKYSSHTLSKGDDGVRDGEGEGIKND